MPSLHEPKKAGQMAFRITLAFFAFLLPWIIACHPPGSSTSLEQDGAQESSRPSSPEVVVQRRSSARPVPKRLKSYPQRGSDNPSFDEATISQFPFQNTRLGGRSLVGMGTPGPTAIESVKRVTAEIRDAMASGPTEVVWLIDNSPSATRWHHEIVQEVTAFYQSFKASPSKAKNRAIRI